MQILENFIWNYLTIPLLLGIGLFFTVVMKFPQIRFKNIKQSFRQDESSNELSPVATLMIALSARVGVGTLAGTGLAIAVGGPGAVFWMWISAIITAGAAFVENTFAQEFKRKKRRTYFGGPAIYINDGLKNKLLAITYSILFIVTYTFGFVAVQTNTMTTTIKQNMDINPLIIGVVLTILTGFVITGSREKISKLIAKIIPYIAILFFGIGIVTIITNLDYVPQFFQEIVGSAFGLGAATGGGIGVAIATGIKRGVFSNEAGIGTGSHAAAITHHKDPREQGYIGIVGIYFTTIVSISLVAFIIMSSGSHLNVVATGNGIEFLHHALLHFFGPITAFILPILIFTFAFSTIITAYLYGVMNVEFLTDKKNAITVLRSLLLIIVFISALVYPGAIWSLVDIGVGIIAIINLIAIFLLWHKAK